MGKEASIPISTHLVLACLITVRLILIIYYSIMCCLFKNIGKIWENYQEFKGDGGAYGIRMRQVTRDEMGMAMDICISIWIVCGDNFLAIVILPAMHSGYWARGG